MTLGVAVAAEGERPPLSAARVRTLARGVLRAERVRHALVSIAFVTPRAIARLNRTHLGHAGPTDVIAFSFGREGRHQPRREPLPRNQASRVHRSSEARR